MAIKEGWVSLDGSEHVQTKNHADLNKTPGSEPVTVTLILRRRADGEKPRAMNDFSAKSGNTQKVSRADFAAAYGADQKDLDQVTNYAKAQNLEVLEADPARRSVVVRGTADAVNKAFDVELHDYASARGKYRSHAGQACLPTAIAKLVEGITGLDNHKVPAQHFSTARRRGHSDPAQTKPLTPQQIATLYNFPSGTGAGQTIGIYEM
jgi:kumamolisin